MSGASTLTDEYIIQKIDELPTLPTIVYELNKIISDPMSSTSEVETIMEKDTSLTTRVLKLVNSAYYAIPGGVSNLSRAIAYLGFDTVQQLVLSATVIDTLNTGVPSSNFDVSKFWQHSMGVAMAAETLAQTLNKPNHADLFTCGLLHDLGKVALLQIAPELLVSISEHAIQNDLNMNDAEIELKAPKHSYIGHLLTKKWELPMKIQMSALFHHEYNTSKRPGVSSDLSETVDIVILANLLVHALKFGESGHRKILPAPKSLLSRINANPGDVTVLIKKIKKSLENADTFLQIIGSS